MTSEQANTVYNISSITAIVAIVITLVAAWGTYAAGMERDRHSDLRQQGIEKEIALANQRAGEANERAQNANLRAQILENENLKLKFKFAKRNITQKQIELLISELAKAPDTIELFFVIDPEAQAYADFFRKAFKKAKWKVIEFPLTGGLSANGLEIREAPNSPNLHLGSIFAKCDISFSDFPEKSPEHFNLTIGTKPTISLD